MSPVVVDAAGGQLRRLRATACAVTRGRAETVTGQGTDLPFFASSEADTELTEHNR
jgi:hypothetical protein